MVIGDWKNTLKQNILYHMTTEDFNDFVSDWTNKIKKTLQKKGGEYTTGDDRLSNFRTTNEIEKIVLGDDFTPEKTLFTKMTKQLDGVFGMLRDKSKITSYMIDEKFGDVVCYLILLSALLTEQLKEKEIRDITNQENYDLYGYSQ